MDVAESPDEVSVSDRQFAFACCRHWLVRSLVLTRSLAESIFVAAYPTWYATSIRELWVRIKHFKAV